MNTTTTGQRNIVAVFDLAAQGEVIDGMDWYDRAGNVAGHLSNLYNVTPAAAAGVIAALSPNNRWERNTIDAENIIRVYAIAGAEEAMNVKVCTYGKMKDKAIQILESPTMAHHEDILNGRKITAFYQCIIGCQDAVCIDGHAYSIWFGDRLTMKNVPNIGKKLYAEIVSDYVEAAEILREAGSLNRFANLTAYEVQAITWVTWRRLHGITK